ncbi:hypothetical protein ROZALSC1DRAFT_28466, partial [Rozella allomycis CSF55]
IFKYDRVGRKKSKRKRNILYVCSKCNEGEKDKLACVKREKIPMCANEDILDIEDLVEDKPCSTGEILYRRIVRNFVKSDEWKINEVKMSPGDNSSGNIDAELPSYIFNNESDVELIPFRCLSMCDQANCIAIRHPDKFAYQFGSLSCNKEGIESDVDGYTKGKTRPTGLRKTILSRIPAKSMKE